MGRHNIRKVMRMLLYNIEVYLTLKDSILVCFLAHVGHNRKYLGHDFSSKYSLDPSNLILQRYHVGRFTGVAFVLWSATMFGMIVRDLRHIADTTHLSADKHVPYVGRYEFWRPGGLPFPPGLA